MFDEQSSRPVSLPVDDDAQTLSDIDQTSADGDQTGSDLDQSVSEADQSAADRDQRASDRDQEAADRDEVSADDGPSDEGADHAAYADTRRARSESTRERDRTAHLRMETSRIRDEAASRRDRMADERDDAARARDLLAAALDAEIERRELEVRHDNGNAPAGTDVLLRAANDRKRAGAGRSRAALHREEAARDRERAAEDRRQAEQDRDAAAEELALEGIDHLTGALRRRVGFAAIQREMDRSARTDECLVLAFIDVDGLKRVNDSSGHAAGDELLRDVAQAIRQHLRSYDVIARFGGDEFVCSLTGQDASEVRDRFEQISSKLLESAEGATITVGLAERRALDTLDELIERADAAMIEARRR